MKYYANLSRFFFAKRYCIRRRDLIYYMINYSSVQLYTEMRYEMGVFEPFGSDGSTETTAGIRRRIPE